jgi:hypothetical protein
MGIEVLFIRVEDKGYLGSFPFAEIRRFRLLLY